MPEKSFKRLFGADGMRGLANVDVTPDLFVQLGRALAGSLAHHGTRRPRVVVGRDPRPSSELLEAAFAAGVCSGGVDVHTVGVIPTAGVAYLTPHLQAAAGAVVTASHNPLADNGLKIFDGRGYKYTDQAEIALETALAAPRQAMPPQGRDVGRIHQEPDAAEAYLRHLTEDLPSLQGLEVVVDSAHGAAAAFAAEAYRRAGATVHEVASDRTGNHINCGVGATNPSFITAATRERPGAIGLAHDGDADRLMAVDETGRLVDGADFLAIFALHGHRAGTAPYDTVVTSPVTNSGLRISLAEHGIDVVESAVGDRPVLRTMLDGGHRLGGEHYGHVIMLDHATTGDGILTALRLMQLMVTTGRTLADLADIWTRTPQSVVNVPVPHRRFLDDHPDIVTLVESERAQLADRGRLIVRTSTIESVVRVSCEASDQDEADAVAQRVVDGIRTRLENSSSVPTPEGDRLVPGP